MRFVFKDRHKLKKKKQLRERESLFSKCDKLKMQGGQMKFKCIFKKIY